MEPNYEVVWPKSPRGIASNRLADRLDTVGGKRVAFVWDYLFRGDELFPILERELVRRFPDIQVVNYDQFGNSHGSDESEFIEGLPAALASRHIDAVVSGMGC